MDLPVSFVLFLPAQAVPRLLTSREELHQAIQMCLKKSTRTGEKYT